MKLAPWEQKENLSLLKEQWERIVMSLFSQSCRHFMNPYALPVFIMLSLSQFSYAGDNTLAHGYEFNRPSTGEMRCNSLLTKSNPTALERLASQLSVKSDVIASILSTLQASTQWHYVEGLFFYGSRAHQYWGFGYDLDVLIMPFNGASKPFSQTIQDHSHWDTAILVKKLYTDLLEQEGFKVDWGNSGPFTVDSLLTQTMDSSQEKSFLETIQPALEKAKMLAAREAQLKVLDISEQADLKTAIEYERRAGNPFFNLPHGIQFSDFPLSLRIGYRNVANKLGLLGIFLTTRSPILLKKNGHTLEVAGQLSRRGYRNIYFILPSGEVEQASNLLD